MRKRLTLALLLAVTAGLLGLATGCKSKKALTRTDNGELPAQRNEGAAAEPVKPAPDTLHDATCHFYTANFSCTVRNIGVTGQIRMAGDSAIWVSVNKVIEMGRGMLTPGRVQAFVKLANRYVDCGWNDLLRRWGVDIDYNTVQALLLANRPPEMAGRKVTLRCDKSKKRPATIELTTTSGQRISCRYEQMTQVDGQWLPSTISLDYKNHRHQEATTLKLERITLDHRKDMPFSIPKSYKPF